MKTEMDMEMETDTETERQTRRPTNIALGTFDLWARRSSPRFGGQGMYVFLDLRFCHCVRLPLVLSTFQMICF